MPLTVAQLTTQLRRVFNDATTTQIEDAINLAHERFILACPIAGRTVEQISVTAGTRNYALQAGVIEVLEVYWVTSASASKRLSQRTFDEIAVTADAESRGYPVLASATPASYHIQGDATTIKAGDLQIVLTPPPTPSTSGDYPKIHVYETVVKSLTSSDPLPDGPALTIWYRNEAAKNLAQELRPGRVGEFKTQADELLPICQEYWHQLVPSTDPTGKPFRKP